MTGRYDLVDRLHDYGPPVKVHGDRILSHANWEILVDWAADIIRTLLKSCVGTGKVAQTLQVSQELMHAMISRLTETSRSLLVDTETVRVNQWRRGVLGLRTLVH